MGGNWGGHRSLKISFNFSRTLNFLENQGSGMEEDPKSL